MVPTQGAGRGRAGRHRRRCGRVPTGGGQGCVVVGMPMGVGMRGRGSPGAVVHVYYREAMKKPPRRGAGGEGGPQSLRPARSAQVAAEGKASAMHS